MHDTSITPDGDSIPGHEVLSPDDCAAAPTLDWAYLSASFLLRQPIELAISSIMEEIGTQAGADRMWMFEYDDALLRFRNTHEWRRPGVSSHVQDLQNAPVTMISWLQQYLAAGKAVLINDVAAMPRAARTLQVEMLRQADRSVLSVPVIHEGCLQACIGFDMVTVRRWTHAETKALFQCAGLIAIARCGGLEQARNAAERAEDFSPLIYLRRQGVRADAIVGLYAARNYTEVWLTDGSMVLDLRPLAQWSALAPQAAFLRIHRTAIVNLQHVRDIDRLPGGRWQVRLREIDRPWAVSRPYRQELRMRLGI